MAFFDNLKTYRDAVAKASELTAANAELEAATKTLLDDNAKALAGQTAAISERDAARAEVATMKTELAAAKLAVTDFDVKVEKASSAKSQQRIASLGHAPVPLAGSDGNRGGVQTEKLFGRDRFAAGIKAKSEKLN